jgi:hypothetical protein
MKQPETSNEATDSDQPNDVARRRCTPWLCGTAGAANLTVADDPANKHDQSTDR